MPRLSRRAFLGSAAALGCAGVLTYGHGFEEGWLEVVRLDLPLPRLPDAFADFTIAQLSDLHFGPLVGPDLIEPAVETVLSLEPDVIVVTGDFVTRVSHGEPDMIEQTLSRLHAPYGVFAVLGNHDWWENASFVRDAVKQTGIRDLNNEHISWQRGGQSLYLAGLDDVLCGKQDFAAALRGIPAGAAIVALIHEPDYADVTANDPRVILQLSGHSHGGQVRVPYIGGIMFPPLGRKYTIGLNYVRDLVVYTNRGIGVIGPPIRVACRPEITLFTLKPG